MVHLKRIHSCFLRDPMIQILNFVSRFDEHLRFAREEPFDGIQLLRA